MQPYSVDSKHEFRFLTSHPLPCLHKLGIVFILFCLCSCFLNHMLFWFILSFLEWGGFISQLLCFLRKAGWKEMYFFLPLYFIFWLLMAFWMEIIFPQNFKGVVSIAIFYFVCMKPSVTLMNNPAHGIYFFSLEVFRIFALFLKYRNFIQKINFFSLTYCSGHLMEFFSLGNTYFLWFFFFLVLFLCISYLTISLLQFIHSLFVELPLFRYENWIVSLTFQIPFI